MRHTTNKPLAWLDSFDNYYKKYKEDIISWFNNKMDTLIVKQGLLQFNNDANCLSDVVDCIKDMALICIASDLDSTPKEIEYYVSIMENKDDIRILTHRYCKEKFDKVLTN